MVWRSSAWSLPWEKVILMMLLTPCGLDFVNTLLYHLKALQLSFFLFFLFSFPTLSQGYNTPFRRVMQLQEHGRICYSRSMTKDEELEQLRAEKRVLCERLRRKDEELEQLQQANTDLREGLKQAIIAMGSQQERVRVLEGLIDSQQERIKTLERQQAKDSHNSSLPPSFFFSSRRRHTRLQGDWSSDVCSSD